MAAPIAHLATLLPVASGPPGALTAAAEGGGHGIGGDLLVLGVLFVIAYVLGRLGKLIGLPAIPVYMIVGLLASPHTEIFPLNFHAADVQLLAVFGLILLLFNLGLEFDQEEFFSNAGRVALAGGAYIVINFGVGWAFGALVGWGPREALIIAGMVGTCSSAIITKLLIELRRLANPETPAILGVTVFGDIFVAVYLAIDSVVLSGKTSFWPIVQQLSIAIAFLVVMFLLSRYAVKPLAWLLKVKDDELFTVLFFGLVVLFAGLGEITGVTDAIGAFLIGLLFGATRYAPRVERISEPLRDIFAAFFFLNFGLSLDIREFPSVVPEVLVAVGLTLVLSYASGVVIAALNKMPHRSALNIAAIFVSRGEFTLILATLALGAGLDERLVPFAGLYVLIMAIVGPLLAANSEKFGRKPAKARIGPASTAAVAFAGAASGDSQDSDQAMVSDRASTTADAARNEVDSMIEQAMLTTDNDPHGKRPDDFFH